MGCGASSGAAAESTVEPKLREDAEEPRPRERPSKLRDPDAYSGLRHVKKASGVSGGGSWSSYWEKDKEPGADSDSDDSDDLWSDRKKSSSRSKGVGELRSKSEYIRSSSSRRRAREGSRKSSASPSARDRFIERTGATVVANGSGEAGTKGHKKGSSSTKEGRSKEGSYKEGSFRSRDGSFGSGGSGSSKRSSSAKGSSSLRSASWHVSSSLGRRNAVAQM